MQDGSCISCIIHVEAVAFQVAEAEDDMGQFAGGEAVDVRPLSCIIADDGQFFLTVGGRLGEAGLRQQDKGEGEKHRKLHNSDL